MNRFSHLFWPIAAAVFLMGCGPKRPPKNAFTDPTQLLAAEQSLRNQVKSFRISGRVDHFGEKRIQGKIYIFAELPDKLRIELLSPIGSSPLSILVVNGDEFSMSDKREGRYLYGPALPCNIARLINLPLRPEEIIAVLSGMSPRIDGAKKMSWSGDGFYLVEITNDSEKQRLEIGPHPHTLPLNRSVLSDGNETTLDLVFDKWRPVTQIPFPHEIRAKMPRKRAELLIRYDADGVDLNVDLPKDAWQQTPPPGIAPERVDCN